MYLMGQALFSRLLIERQHALRTIRTIALCAVDDTVLRPLAERFGIEVVVDTAGAAETLADTTPECAGQAWDQPVRTDQHPYDVRKSSERGGDGGNSAAYLVARLKRDAPEICDRSAFRDSGIFRSRSSTPGAIHEKLQVEFGVGFSSQSDLMRRPCLDARSIAGGQYGIVSLSRSRSVGCGLTSST
jgi:hypothetical protein